MIATNMYTKGLIFLLTMPFRMLCMGGRHSKPDANTTKKDQKLLTLVANNMNIAIKKANSAMMTDIKLSSSAKNLLPITQSL